MIKQLLCWRRCGRQRGNAYAQSCDGGTVRPYGDHVVRMYAVVRKYAAIRMYVCIVVVVVFVGYSACAAGNACERQGTPRNKRRLAGRQWRKC